MSINMEGLAFLGWFAVVGGVLNTIGDWALLGFPIAGRDIKLELIKDKPAGHVKFGVYIGMIAIPMWLGVIFPVAYLLRTAPVVYTVIASIGLVLLIMYSQTYHVSYIFYDIAYREENDEVIAKSLIEKKRMQMFTAPVGLIATAALVIGGILAGAPIWWIVFNPLVLQGLLLVTARALPAPIGGYVLTGGGSFSFAIFGLVTMLAV